MSRIRACRRAIVAPARVMVMAVMLVALVAVPHAQQRGGRGDTAPQPQAAPAPPIPGETPAAQATGPAPSGNIAQGKRLYDDALRCYACHGFDGQTGSPRIVPQQRTQDAFIALLRKPARPAMPKFVDVPAQDLADLYAYIRSIPVAAPPADSIPHLKSVLQRRAQSTQTHNPVAP